MQAVARWIWEGRTALARLVRMPLSPLSGAMGVAVTARAAAYHHGWLGTRALPRPSVAVGNLTVGGTGKTPVAAWVAGFFIARGARPGILLHGGPWRDEALVHHVLQPQAVVVEHRRRAVGAAEAIARGAEVLVLDDAYQRLDVTADLNVLLVSADSFAEPRLLPAGPWREGLGAADRAHLVVITRKCADRDAAGAVARRLRDVVPLAPFAFAHLRIAGFTPLRGGPLVPAHAIARRSICASAGIADHASFGGQLAELGAGVRRLDWPDHHRYVARDLARILAAGREVDHVIVTGKDAVKLGELWPRHAPDPLVAELEVHWEAGRQELTGALNRVLRKRPCDNLN